MTLFRDSTIIQYDRDSTLTTNGFVTRFGNKMPILFILLGPCVVKKKARGGQDPIGYCLDLFGA